MSRKPTDPFYHTDRFKIEWIDDPENDGVKSACGRFILRDLPPYQLSSGKWVCPSVLIDNSPTWFEFANTTSKVFRLRSDALCEAETRRRQDE